MSPQNARQRPPIVRLYENEGCIDGFAGGGGTSTGIEEAIGQAPDVAINHDIEALSMHLVNHPETRHIVSNIRIVNYRTVLKGKKCGFAWFSPDCTFHSKARGGKPFRDADRARRIRGLAWEAVRCAEAIQPRVIFIENVEEFQHWGPLKNGQPDPAKRGASFRRWVARLRNMGYAVEWRELRASDFGAPTSRKRLFIIARCDGQPIVWPRPTHGPKTALPYRTAAECIDFSLPVPSIFLTPAQARKWGNAHGVPAPKRPLASATKRRIARGVVRYVLEAADPFLVPVTHPRDARVYSVHEPVRTVTSSKRGEFALVAPTLINTRNGERKGQQPRVMDIRQPYNTITAQGSQGAIAAAFLAKFHGERRPGEEGARGQQLDLPIRTLDTSNRFALVQPTIAPFIAKHYGGRVGSAIDEPLHTVMANGAHHALVAPSLVRVAHGERDAKGKKRGRGEHSLGEPLPTQTASNDFALLAPVLVQNSETRDDRVHAADEPIRTITAAGGRTMQMVAAYLAKHNAGHEATGQQLGKPCDTVTTRDSKALVTSHLVKLRGGHSDHVHTAQDVREPLPTLTAGGTHVAEVRTTLVPADSLDPAHVVGAVKTCAFIVKFFGTGVARSLTSPADTLTTKARIGLVEVILVNVGGNEFLLVDIGMRMLQPRELYLAQGFPAAYVIDHGIDPILKTRRVLTKQAQTRLVGNSVPPHLSRALVAANLERSA